MDPKLQFEIDEVCRRFEDQWLESKNDSWPDLNETLLSLPDTTLRASICPLLVLDTEYREAAGLPHDLANYKDQLGDFAPLAVQAWESIVEDSHARVIEEPIDDLATELPDEQSRLKPPIAALKPLGISPTNKSPGETREKIGRYTILGEIGKGGQGTVYKALHPDLDVMLALKVGTLRLGPDGRDAMASEAKLLSALDHANIARLRDLEFDENGHPILVLEYLGGRSMEQLLRAGSVSIHRAVTWLQQISDAVDYAHRKGVTHLDLKPSNVIITEDDSAKVIDFGLARLDGFYQSDPKRDGIRGTPAYMSPEQARGEASKISSQSDIFSLGAILFRILTGAPPFYESNGRDSIRRAAKCDVDWHQLEESDAPDELKVACRQAMGEDTGSRFETAADFGKSINRQDNALEPVPEHPSKSQARLVMGLCIAGLMILPVTLLFWPGLWGQHSPSDRSAWLTDGNAMSSDELVKEFLVTASRNRGTLVPIEDVAPLRNGDSIHFALQLTEPAYVKLFWVDAAGEISELYPNDPEKGLLDEGLPVTRFDSPVELDRGWPLEGSGGLETAFLMVSRTPINTPEFGTPIVAQNILSGTDSVVRYEAVRAGHVRRINKAENLRSLGTQSQVVDDAILQAVEKLRKSAEVVQAVTITHIQ